MNVPTRINFAYIADHGGVIKKVQLLTISLRADQGNMKRRKNVSCVYYVSAILLPVFDKYMR